MSAHDHLIGADGGSTFRALKLKKNTGPLLSQIYLFWGMDVVITAITLTCSALVNQIQNPGSCDIA